LLSTLSSYVAAMGGKLRLFLEFPNRPPIAIALADIADHAPREPKRRGRMKARAPAKSGAAP
jgi:hypothetical protein